MSFSACNSSVEMSFSACTCNSSVEMSFSACNSSVEMSFSACNSSLLKVLKRTHLHTALKDISTLELHALKDYLRVVFISLEVSAQVSMSWLVYLCMGLPSYDTATLLVLLSDDAIG